MRLQIKTRVHVWLFALAATSISIVVSVGSVAIIYALYGANAFHIMGVAYLTTIIPLVVALPTSYVAGTMWRKSTQTQITLQRMAETDELTGLTNRRHFITQTDEHLAAASEQQAPVSLLIIDADYFKQLNDTYGHATGDAALEFISQKLAAGIRRSDLACRLGGEEFAILLPGVSASQAQPTAERILTKISAQPMVHDGKIIEMSVSCGVADTNFGDDMTSLFKAAYNALNAAKNAGRNKAVVFSRNMLSDRPATSAPASPESS